LRTLIIITGGFVLYGIILLLARQFHAPVSAAPALSAKIFIPLWIGLAALNMWIGVTQAGYSVAEELPIFLLIAGLPAAAAAIVWWTAV